MAELFVLRHGNTFDKGDTITRVGARTDLPLSTSGMAQANALQTHFKNTQFDAAFCSPLLRTRQTARCILSAHPGAPPLLILPFLTEIDYGVDENQPEETVTARIGSAALEAWESDAVPPPGWDVDPDALKNAWRDVIQRASQLPLDTKVLIVTSNGIARFLPDIVDNRPKDLARKLKTGAWGCIQIKSGRAEITRWNERP